MSNKIWAIISITVILIALSAFTWAWAQEAPEPSDWVKISAKPAKYRQMVFLLLQSG